MQISLTCYSLGSVNSIRNEFVGLTFSSKLDWGSYIISIAKTVSKKIRALIRSMKFLLRLLCISINLPYAPAWNTFVTSGPPVVTWNC